MSRQPSRCNRLVVYGWVLSQLAPGLLVGQPVREFEAVSVKPYRPQGPPFESCNQHNNPGMLNMVGCTLRQFVKLAYNLKPYQMAPGVAPWIDDDRFVIQARASSPANNRQMMEMLQPVLADRFRLKIHWTDREGPAYLLEVASHGLKLQPATKTNHCGEVNVRDTKLWADCLSIDDIVDVLQDLLKEHPVVNRTGVGKDARYQVDLQYSMGDDPAAGPSIFVALPDQLGLSIKAGKAPVHMLVIDRVARPQGN
jgi:uncharacterized protein (TIGR03435 family)